VKIFKFLPTGPKMFPISPFGKAMDWNFSPWTRLCPLYTILCPFPGLEIGRTVPSMKPKQLFRGDPFQNWDCFSILLNSNWAKYISIPLCYEMTVVVINKIHDFICNQTQNRNWSWKTWNHIAESAGITCSSQQQTQSLQTITNASLFAMEHCGNM